MNLDKLTVKKQNIQKGSERIKANRTIADTMDEIAEDYGEERFTRRAKSMRLCYKYWDFDYYRIQAVKDIRRVNLCKDLFCMNCQHNLSLKRQAKYSPVLDELRKDYGIYHVVFTVPNCSGATLPATVERMYSKFVYVNQYFQSKRKIKGIDLKQFGYVGNIRALEVSVNRNNKPEEWYHPHFHCIFLLKKGFKLEKKLLNKFSFDSSGKRSKPCAFSPFEVFLQKFWYCLYNDIRASKKNIDEAEGYSVKVEKCSEKKYHEVFKYAVGGLFKKGNLDILSDEDGLLNLDSALRNRRMIQGYGVFRKIVFDDDVKNEEREKIYQMIRDELKQVENPVFCTQSLDELKNEIKDHPEITFISKSLLHVDNA